MESVELESHVEQNLRTTNFSRYNQSSTNLNPLIGMDTIKRVKSPKETHDEDSPLNQV